MISEPIDSINLPTYLTRKGRRRESPKRPSTGLTWKPSMKTFTCGATRETIPKVKSERKMSSRIGAAILMAVSQRVVPSPESWLNRS